MKKELIYICLSAVIALAACSKDYELTRSVFIADKEYPDLPAYTEYGYNTFGAYFDRKLFIYNDDIIPVKIINTGGKTSFALEGQFGSYGYYYPNNENRTSLIFELEDFLPESISYLLALNDTIIDLSNPLCHVSLKVDTTNYKVVILNGNLNFKRAQNLIVDKQPVEVILSGTFEFQALINDEPKSFTLGRFDFGIGMDNFYHY
jgi:hypothetical protein